MADVDLEDAAWRMGGEAELNRKASDLARLALFTEHKRLPLRREDISKKVLGSNTRSFNSVLSRAQALLRETFAMELVELQSRNYREEPTAVEDDLQEARNATGVRKRASAAGSRTYILRSVLDPIIIEHAALTDERLFEEQVAEAPNDEDEDEVPRYYGSIISWSTFDQLTALGVLHVVLALVLVNGRAISDLDLRANLKRLRMQSGTIVPMNSQSTHRSVVIDTYLGHLIRQGYIDRVHLGNKKVVGEKRVRVPPATQVSAEESHAYEWRWGNRAHSEIGEQAVASFVAEFMVESLRQAGIDEDDEEQSTGEPRSGRGRARESGGEKQLQVMQRAIERAAGGNLSNTK